jgi:hypothetical protein
MLKNAADLSAGQLFTAFIQPAKLVEESVKTIEDKVNHMREQIDAEVLKNTNRKFCHYAHLRREQAYMSRYDQGMALESYQ